MRIRLCSNMEFSAVSPGNSQSFSRSATAHQSPPPELPRARKLFFATLWGLGGCHNSLGGFAW